MAEKRKRILRYALLTLIPAAIAAVLFAVLRAPGKELVREMQVFPESGFYRENIRVTLDPEGNQRNGTVYYTLNGETPTEEDPAFPDEGMELEATAGGQVIPLNVRMRTEEGWEKAVHRDYILCTSDSTFTLPVVCLTTDRRNLYDEETGILAEGTHSGETDPATGEVLLPNTMQTGPEWIRSVYVSFIRPEGETAFSQEAGLAVSGGTSRSYAHPSMKIIADAWEEGIEFLFSGMDDSDLSLWPHVTSYHDLKLRTGSQDAAETNIRSAVISRLCAGSGFPGYLPEERASIWINGEWYSLCSVQPRFIPSWLKDRFSLEDASCIEIIGESERGCVEGFQMERLFSADLNDPVRRAMLEEKVDMEDYLFYVALQAISNNVDWPGNNFKMWRYTGESDPENPYTDGRYRCLLYDSDLTWLPPGYLTGIFGEDTFRAILDNDVMEDGIRGYRSYIGNVLQAETYRDRFVQITESLLDGVFSPEHISSVIDEETERIRQETILREGEEAWRIRCLATEGMKEQAALARQRIEKDFEEYFQLREKCRFTVRNAEGMTLCFGQTTLRSGETYDGSVYRDVQMEVRGSPNPGYRLAGWMVNGRRMEGETIQIGGKMAGEDGILLEALSERDEEAGLMIAEICNREGGDWIRFRNTGTGPVRLREYLVSDSREFRKAERLPDLTLNADESILLKCRGDQTGDGFRFSFGLKKGETLCLWKAGDGRLIQQIRVPEKSEVDTYGIEPGGSRFVYFGTDPKRQGSCH